MPPGYFGRYLRVDPRPGRTGSFPWRKTFSAASWAVSGWGRGSWRRETEAGVDPLGPEAALVFALSPLVGSPLTTSAKFAVVAFSPLTGRVCDALSSSHFAIAAKRAGVDAIAVSGACDEPSVAFVDGIDSGEPRVRWEPAGELVGHVRHETPRMRSASDMETNGRWRRSGRRASG